MKDGLYHVNFKSNQQDFGVGVVTVENGRINGGDYAYFYQGKTDGESATLKVTRHNDQATSVFGPIKEFVLELRVSQGAGGHILEGHIQGQPAMQIQIHAKFLSDLS